MAWPCRPHSAAVPSTHPTQPNTMTKQQQNKKRKSGKGRPGEQPWGLPEGVPLMRWLEEKQSRKNRADHAEKEKAPPTAGSSAAGLPEKRRRISDWRYRAIKLTHDPVSRADHAKEEKAAPTAGVPEKSRRISDWHYRAIKLTHGTASPNPVSPVSAGAGRVQQETEDRPKT